MISIRKFYSRVKRRKKFIHKKESLCTIIKHVRFDRLHAHFDNVILVAKSAVATLLDTLYLLQSFRSAFLLRLP